ncbi:hypothetical protein Scep_018823 [Stephania cephalantha]|uniref:Bulb-type lectin domain-containing protein n=1 Tax=Stephania cephalantha TaxID=152367 RepID=A0AAP0I9L7_9MAGN
MKWVFQPKGSVRPVRGFGAAGTVGGRAVPGERKWGTHRKDPGPNEETSHALSARALPSLPKNGIYNMSWTSPSGRFAFGFYPQGDGFIVAIWFARIPERTVVWSLIQDDKQRLQLVVTRNATLVLNKEGWFILRDERGDEKNIFGNPAASAAMLDSGNFVLHNSTSQIIWQTFDSPTNTILQGQRLSNGKGLVSSVSRIEGRFYQRMQDDGNLVPYSAQYGTNYKVSDAYWEYDTVGQGSVALNLDDNGRLYLINGTSAYIRNFTNGWNSPNNGTMWFYQITLDADGLFRVYSHSLDQNGSWSVRWSLPINKCEEEKCTHGPRFRLPLYPSV